MTFSIVGRDGSGGFGVAVASHFLAVGAWVPAAAAQVGALATQADTNVRYRRAGIDLLRCAVDPAAVVHQLVTADRFAERRQVGVVAAVGEGAAYTGDGCQPWAGHLTGVGYAVQGNLCTGPEVLAAMEQAWLEGGASPLRWRLLAALAAGEAQGGDARGTTSAALLVVRPFAGYGGTSDAETDLRVDSSADPLGDLTALLDAHDEAAPLRLPAADPWLPADFRHPSRLDLVTGHHLRPIRAADTPIDHRAVMGSRDSLWARYGERWGWPPATMTAAQDHDDLVRHEREMAANLSFNYALFDEGEEQLLGCVYIDPPEPTVAGAALVSWWVIDALRGTPLEQALRSALPPWLRDTWRVADVRFDDPDPSGARSRDRAPDDTSIGGAPR